MWVPQRSLLVPGMFFLLRDFAVRVDFALCRLINGLIPDDDDQMPLNTLMPVIWTELTRLFSLYVLGNVTRVRFPKLFTTGHPLAQYFGIRLFRTPLDVMSFLIYHTEIILPLDCIAERTLSAGGINVFTVRRSYMRRFCVCIPCSRVRARLYRQFFADPRYQTVMVSDEVQTEPLADQSRCVVCLENASSVSLIHGRTAHDILCETCLRGLTPLGEDVPFRCPLCRKMVERVARFFSC